MNRITSPEEIPTDLSLPSECRFRIWSRARLEVGDRHVVLEGSHAGLMLELLRNRGRRVPASLLWASMLRNNGETDSGGAVQEEVAMEVRRVRYVLAAKGILLSVDDSEPQEGFMLSDLCRIACDPPTRPHRKKSRSRKTQKGISGDVSERPSFKPGHAAPPDVPYSVPERLERRTMYGAEK